jgi:hypothetical protein
VGFAKFPDSDKRLSGGIHIGYRTGSFSNLSTATRVFLWALSCAKRLECSLTIAAAHGATARAATVPSPHAAEVSFMLHVQNYGFRLNLALSRFSPEDRRRIGVHTCPGGDLDSTHSADVDYAVLPRSLFELKTRSFYIALAGEQDGPQVLRVIRKHLKPDQRIFVGVIAPIDVCSLIEARRGRSTWQADGGAWLP